MSTLRKTTYSHEPLQPLPEHLLWVTLSSTDTLAVATSEVATETLRRSSLISSLCMCGRALWAPESTTISETSPPYNVHGNQAAMGSFLLLYTHIRKRLDDGKAMSSLKTYVILQSSCDFCSYPDRLTLNTSCSICLTWNTSCSARL